ncbi:MltR family transcriptional regulator [Pseudomonas sp. 18175]|uniref:MltR family transcriptional regulator n=1 Tax=Pseudomonas sp. 18175 TaxID=3390056 RepID=UPI003D25279F
MLPTATTAQLVDGFNAPLGNFSSRIKATYSLGLITKEQFGDLEQLRKIRNYFAHSWKPIGFDDKRIAGHIRSLRFSSFGADFPDSPKEKLRSSIFSLLVALNSVTNSIAKKGCVQLTGYDLITGFSGEFEEQIEEVTKLFDQITLSLQTSSGDRYAFDRAELQRLQSRLRLITNPKTEVQHNAVLRLRDEISARLALR